MNLWKYSLMMVFVLATAGITSAQQNQRQLTNPERPRGRLINDVAEAKIAMHPVTPFVEASTVALVKIDLARLDLDANLRAIDAMGESNEAVRSFMRGTVESLRRAGVDAFYLVAGTRSVTDGGPLVVIPCEDTTAVRNLAEAMISQLPNRGQLKSHEGKEVVLAGPQAAIDRVLNAESVLRPRLLLPLTQQS